MTSRMVLLTLSLILAAGAIAPLSAQAGAVREVAEAAADERAAPEWAAGQICWAFYDPDSAWYAAHVVTAEADSIRVRHFDGFEEWVVPHYVMRDQLAAGDSLGAWYAPDSQWYSAEVVQRRGLEIVVRYSDGEEESTWMRWLRIRTAAPPAG